MNRIIEECAQIVGAKGKPGSGNHMTESRTIHDPFLGKNVEISDRLVDRLRGRYAQGPTMPNGEPEFGWRQFETPPIQHEAAAEIERLRAAQPQYLSNCLRAGACHGKCESTACTNYGKNIVVRRCVETKETI